MVREIDAGSCALRHNHSGVEMHGDEVVGRNFVVIHSGGLDEHSLRPTVIAAGVAAMHGDKTRSHQGLIDVTDLFSQLGGGHFV